jgi:hypothetical protein
MEERIAFRIAPFVTLVASISRVRPGRGAAADRIEGRRWGDFEERVGMWKNAFT